ncbi:Gfo/Idh/MocA family protein [Curtobacterium oceanosedimentum]|uniref:Oxidoreductase n=1 Tax=Curtobacterium oceanosedimentum TaxID=465820 RepID=A0A147DT94_9MICO|nr:Gfo/Idh/MocA family oxidoreductase [Curtobacterium oceanosedimentum]KTR53587.1 oxidoreductase [Curtobacterium oceanosedimentum]
MTEHAPLRVVQVGAGGMGRAWLGTVAADPDVELVGVVDLDLDAARAGAELAGAPTVPVGRDLPALLAETGAEAVLDITVPVAHHPVTMDALHAGLPVLGEKPAAQTVAEALSLAAAAEATGQLFMVSQSRRYNDQLVAFRQHVRALGGVGSLNTRFAKAPHFGGFREEMDDVLLLDMAIHAFDSARYVLEREPVSVYCESWNPAWSWYRGDANAAAVFTFEDDTRYVYDGSWCAPGDETSWNGDWRATGASGSAAWDGDHDPSSVVDGAPGAPAPAPGVGTEIAGALASFVRAVRTGTTPDGEVHGNVMSLVMVDAAIASARSGQRVVVDDVLEQAHATALEVERDDAVRERLAAWGSVRQALASAPDRTPAG